MAELSKSFGSRVFGGRALLILSGLLLVAAGGYGLMRESRPVAPLVQTVADLQTVHPSVSVGGREVRGLERVPTGDRVQTGGEGLARLRVDDGTTVLIDHGTQVGVFADHCELTQGRIFVQGAPRARHLVGLGGAQVLVTGSNAGFQRTPEGGKVYSANQELVVTLGGVERRVGSGETATITGSTVVVAPEKAFDDWTGGLASPWSARGEPRRTVGELWGLDRENKAGGPGSPLALRSHEVEVALQGEFAETTVKTTYFNAGSRTVAGDFRLALPPGALVSHFAWSTGTNPLQQGRITAAGAEESKGFPTTSALEWAGEGWVRGALPAVAAGQLATLQVVYGEWLSPTRHGAHRQVEYRYPLVGSGESPLISELSIRVDAHQAGPLSLSSNLGAARAGDVIQLRQSDVRPAADLVVTAELPDWPAEARAYQVAVPGEPAGDVILVRTELPAAKASDGVVLALVVDTSASMDPALLDTSRAVVKAILGGLGAADRVVVLAADQATRPLGPPQIGPVDPARQKAVLEALEAASPGGATDLGRALEAAADALPKDVPSGMVVYVGDGWPTLGDARWTDIEARLARRAGGVPRLAAIALGPQANHPLLSALARGAGPLLEVADSREASAAAVRLMVEGLRPTLTDVSLEFEPNVEQIYPRTPRALLAGDTAWAAVRARRDQVRSVTLHWRDSTGNHQEVRPAVQLVAPSESDVRRRWALARYEEIMLTGKGKEAAIQVALGAGLLTPWSSLTDANASYQATPLSSRILDLTRVVTTSFDAPILGAGALSAPAEEDDGSDSAASGEKELKEAVAAAARRTMEESGGSLRACRDSRAAVRPDLAGDLLVEIRLKGDGQISSLSVRPDAPSLSDGPLLRCAETVLRGLRYPGAGGTLEVTVKNTLTLNLVPTRRARRCSDLSRLPMPLRRGPWREALASGSPAEKYLSAKMSCELSTWTDRRAFLELALETTPGGHARLIAARELEAAGEVDAAAFLRREAVRRVKSPEDLRSIRNQLLGDEHYPVRLFEKRYAAAGNDAERLEVVKRFLVLAPHDARLQKRSLALLESLGNRLAVLEAARRVREDPFADAGLLAAAAQSLHRVGQDGEARRTFGELIERAPADPWARAFLGDRLRELEWFEDASRAYQALEILAPDLPAGIVRQALAHAGAGRLDIARRMLLRVVQTGGRDGDAGYGALAGDLSVVLLHRARLLTQNAEEKQRLTRELQSLPRAAGRGVWILQPSQASVPVLGRLVPPKSTGRLVREATRLDPGLAIASLELDPTVEKGSRLVLSRPKAPPPAQATQVRLDAVLPSVSGSPPGWVTYDVTLPTDGKLVELEWTGSAWVSAAPSRKE